MRVLAVAAVSCALLVVAGCGGDSNGSGDEAQIEALAETYSQAALDGDAAAACETFSSEAREVIEDLQQFDGCEEFVTVGFGVLSEDQKRELADLSDIQINGDTATAESRDGEISFVKEGGEWKTQLDSGN